MFSSVFAVLVLLDQATKRLVDATFALHESRSLIGDYLLLTYIRNKGAAFGLQVGNPSIMLVVQTTVTLILLYFMYRGLFDNGTALGRFSLVMILAGAVGNLIDRIYLREVIDFIEMGIGAYRWPVYNFADIYVTVGVGLIFAGYFFQPHSQGNETVTT